MARTLEDCVCSAQNSRECICGAATGSLPDQFQEAVAFMVATGGAIRMPATANGDCPILIVGSEDEIRETVRMLAMCYDEALQASEQEPARSPLWRGRSFFEIQAPEPKRVTLIHPSELKDSGHKPFYRNLRKYRRPY